MKTARIILVLNIAAITARAGIVVDTSPPNNNATDIVDSRLAEAFTISSTADITGINFWYQAQFETDLSQVAYAFYGNAFGALGTVIASGDLAPATSFDSANNAYVASLSIPDVSLAVGTYWLELHSGSSLTDNSGFTIWWAATDVTGSLEALFNQGTGLPDSPITDAGFEQYAFQLTGSGQGSPSTPEPSAALLTALGIGALTVARKHRRS